VKKYLLFSLEEIFEALSLSSQKQKKFLEEIEGIKKRPSCAKATEGESSLKL
jgi:hypothetical protein